MPAAEESRGRVGAPGRGSGMMRARPFRDHRVAARAALVPARSPRGQLASPRLAVGDVFGPLRGCVITAVQRAKGVPELSVSAGQSVAITYSMRLGGAF